MGASPKRPDPMIGSDVRVRRLLLALLALFDQACSGRTPPTGASFSFQFSNGCPDLSKYQHCGDDPDGVNDLNCFGIYSPVKTYICTWKPGRGPSAKTYMMVIQQPVSIMKRCITGLSGTSATVQLYPNNVTVEVFESRNSSVCTKAVFQGSISSMIRCGPPDKVTFSRHEGRIDVNARWLEATKIKHFVVKYKAHNSSLWHQSQFKNATAGAVEGLDTSLAYVVQVRCERNKDCGQCPWGHAHHVPPELTVAPDLVDLQDSDFAELRGTRRVSLTWKFPSENVHDGYHVNVTKASGEPSRQPPFRTTEPEIVLILSYSSYRLEVSAFNNVSTSPPLRLAILRREERLGSGAEEPNVTVQSQRSFTISWRADPMRRYVCYCAEWTGGGRRAAYMSFYNVGNSRTLNFKENLDSLEPYTRYTVTLHVRTEKNTCNMKHVNSSESTYGSTQFYLQEGSPNSAPANVSSHNVTQDSAVLRWSSIPEEDARGFLLGYYIYYSEYQQGMRVWKNVAVSPDVSTHKLERLKSSTLYEVRMSGFTRVGEGVRSEARAFTTASHGERPRFNKLIKASAIMTTVLIIGVLAIKRAKQFLWPSIPDPKKSNAMQKMEMTNELDLLQSISTLRVEEWDTDSLQIVQKEHAFATCTSALLDGLEEDLGDARETQPCPAPLAPAGGYTTMEMFRKAAHDGAPLGREGEQQGTAARSRLDYVRQFSTESGWEVQ